MENENLRLKLKMADAMTQHEINTEETHENPTDETRSGINDKISSMMSELGRKPTIGSMKLPSMMKQKPPAPQPVIPATPFSRASMDLSSDNGSESPSDSDSDSWTAVTSKKKKSARTK